MKNLGCFHKVKETTVLARELKEKKVMFRIVYIYFLLESSQVTHIGRLQKGSRNTTICKPTMKSLNLGMNRDRNKRYFMVDNNDGSCQCRARRNSNNQTKKKKKRKYFPQGKTPLVGKVNDTSIHLPVYPSALSLQTWNNSTITLEKLHNWRITETE